MLLYYLFSLLLLTPSLRAGSFAKIACKAISLRSALPLGGTGKGVLIIPYNYIYPCLEVAKIIIFVKTAYERVQNCKIFIFFAPVF